MLQEISLTFYNRSFIPSMTQKYHVFAHLHAPIATMYYTKTKIIFKRG